MTGFGRGTARQGEWEATAELTSVNRRSLEIGVSLSVEKPALERAAVELLRGRFARGKIQATLRWQSASVAQEVWADPALVERQMQALAELARRCHIPYQPDLEVLVRVASLNRSGPASEVPEPAGEAVLAALREAAAALAGMRAREGAALSADLRARVGALAGFRAQVAGQVSSNPGRYREALLARLRQAGLELRSDDERVLKEIALFADRCDVTEELTRLESHLEQFQAALEAPAPEGVGRKLEFILQEILREFNTIGAKANQLETSKVVIEAKNEIERLREQLQNVE